MGFYLDSELLGRNTKISDLIIHYGARPLKGMPERYDEFPGEVIVCVVMNEHWDAALVCYNQHQLKRSEYTTEDQRPRLWLVVLEEVVRQLCPAALKAREEEREWSQT